MADASPSDLIWLEESERERVKTYLRDEQPLLIPVLEATADVIDGFESPLGMEALATVDWLLTKEATGPSVNAIRKALMRWPGGKAAGDRKLRLFDNRLLNLAIDRLLTWYGKNTAQRSSGAE